jgi:hypothetical protein
MTPLRPLSAPSILSDDNETLFELALMVLRAASTLDEEVERLRLERRLAAMLAFTAPRARSTLDEDVETLFELALSVARAASRLDDEPERLMLDAKFVEILPLVMPRAESTLADD